MPEWLPPAGVGLLFTGFGGLKLFGAVRGIVSCRRQSFFTYACATCPTHHPILRWGLPVVFLAVGLSGLLAATLSALR